MDPPNRLQETPDCHPPNHRHVFAIPHLVFESKHQVAGRDLYLLIASQILRETPNDSTRSTEQDIQVAPDSIFNAL